MNFKQANEYLTTLYTRGSHPGLSRVAELLRLTGDPQNKLNIIHIAGTNGKGSVSSMLESILRASGYKTGLFTSPCIGSVCESYRINGSIISEFDFADAVSGIRKYIENMTDKPTGFEFEAALALSIFAEQECGVVILETGMGGGLDATNVCAAPLLSVITDIDYDHQNYLGNTLNEIACAKAGIIKQGRPIVYGGNNALEIIKQKAEENNAPLTLVDYKKLNNIKYSLNGTEFDFGGSKFTTSMLGTYQPRNAAVALTAAKILRCSLGLNITDDTVRLGLADAVWHARFELLRERPPIIYDGAHNAQGMAMCAESIREYFGDKKVNVLMGVMADKNYKAMLDTICPLIDRAYTVTPNNPRALSAKALAGEFKSRGIGALPFERISDGVKLAALHSEADNTPLIILGTLYMYNDVKNCITEANFNV